METDKQIALVTGASRGIGRTIALTLAAHYYRLALNDLAASTETLTEIEEAGGSGFIVPADVSSEESVIGMVADIEASHGPIEVLINNAGVSLQRPAEDLELAEWRRVLDVNLTGPFLLCREVGKRMLGRGKGSIVNVASIAGLLGFADRAAYNASKHGLIGLTRTLAVEWGGRGVRVNAVCPGWVKTEMDARDQAGSGYTDEDITQRIPMARFARTEDIAGAVAFLADPNLSGFVNGQSLAVDGGWSIDGGWETLRLGHR